MENKELSRKKRSQKDYTLCLKLSVVSQVEKGEFTYKQAQNTASKEEQIKEDHLSLIHHYDTVSNNYSENNQLYNIPDFILKNQNECIALLKEEIEELKEEIKNIQIIFKRIILILCVIICLLFSKFIRQQLLYS